MTSYNATIVSFDDDFYYGMFYRQDAEGRKHHLCCLKLDLDDGCERVLPDPSTYIDAQTYIDFEINPLECDRRYILADKINDALKEKARELFQVVKQHGAIANFVILDGGMPA